MSILAAFVLALATLTPAQSEAPRTYYPTCATEDAPGPCAWLSHRDGNGEGASFLVTADQTIVYL